LFNPYKTPLSRKITENVLVFFLMLFFANFYSSLQLFFKVKNIFFYRCKNSFVYLRYFFL
jgi:hypothetical protein